MKRFGYPLGGILAIICFFVPWYKSPNTTTAFSFIVDMFGGVRIIHTTSITLGIVFIASICIIGMFFLNMNKHSEKAKLLFLLIPVISVGILLYGMTSFMHKTGLETTIYGVGPIGIIIGLSISFISSFFK